MSNPIDALRRYIDTSPSLVGLASPSGSYVKKEEMLEVIRLAELGQKVRELECEPKDAAEEWRLKALAAAEVIEQMKARVSVLERGPFTSDVVAAAEARADAFLEALRLIAGVKP